VRPPPSLAHTIASRRRAQVISTLSAPRTKACFISLALFKFELFFNVTCEPAAAAERTVQGGGGRGAGLGLGLGLGGKRTMLIRWVSCTMSSLYAFLYTLMRRAYVKK
jgi:hypothetical protein